MIAAFVQLSDIHFTEGRRNPIQSKISHLAAAVCSIEPMCSDFTVALSGDIANAGLPTEYSMAKNFCHALATTIAERRLGATIRFVCVPGNHDCYLPEEKMALRQLLISGVQDSLHDAVPNASILDELLKNQQDYFEFAGDIMSLAPLHGSDRLCSSVAVEVKTHVVRLNLYNTAVLSKRDEVQGALQAPLGVIQSLIRDQADCDFAVSLFHHPYQWLQHENGIAFRNHIERTSDLALTGHQHVDHLYSKHALHDGSKIVYSEGAELQEIDNPDRSGFRVILIDLAEQRRRIVSFKWANTRYSTDSDTEWQQYSRSASLQFETPIPRTEYLEFLRNSGIGLIHKTKGPIPLKEVYVYPDVTIRRLSDIDTQRELSGERVKEHLRSARLSVIQGKNFSGKTSLAKMIMDDWLRTQSCYPIWLSGADIVKADATSIDRLIGHKCSQRYEDTSVEVYHQLPPSLKALVIDDWDSSTLNADDRDKFLTRATASFGKIILFVKQVSFIQAILARLNSRDVILEFDLITINEMSHVARGELIDRWLALEICRENSQFSRRVEHTERLVQSVIGKNTLPSLPFIVLSLLQAMQRERDVLPENGSFGYLYEVVITAALNATQADKPQLDKKYTFLSLVAFRMFQSSADMLGERELVELLDSYASSFKIKVDKEALLKDLQYSRVLVRENGNFTFGYAHYFHYFLARYFKDHLEAPEGVTLRPQMEAIAGGLNSGTNSIFLMFVIYLTHDQGLIDTLVRMSDRIFAEYEPSNLTNEVEFFNAKDNAGVELQLPESVDLERSRRERREAADRVQDGENRLHPHADLKMAGDSYSEDLPLSTKLEYAVSCTEVLGQILRNFTGSLPGDRKMVILETTYRLGLRTLKAVLLDVSHTTVEIKEELVKRDLKDKNNRQFVHKIEKLLTVFAQMVGSSIVHMISMNIGSPDIEESACADTLNQVGRSNATMLVDLAIKLDHSDEYPFEQIKKLKRMYENNRYCLQLLRALVVSNLHVFDIEYNIRQSVLALFNAKPSGSALLSRSNKRLNR